MQQSKISKTSTLTYPDDVLAIGILGQMQAGKDTLASMIMDQYCSEPAAVLVNLVGDQMFPMSMAFALKCELAAVISNNTGLSYTKVLLEMLAGSPEEKARWRLGMQWWGTEVRRTEDEDYWIHKHNKLVSRALGRQRTETAALQYVIIVPDVRFANEVEYIRSYKHHCLVRVERPGLGDRDAHASESGLADLGICDLIVDNDGDLSDLQYKVEYSLFGQIKARLRVPRSLREDLTGELTMARVNELKAQVDSARLLVDDPESDSRHDSQLCKVCWYSRRVDEHPRSSRPCADCGQFIHCEHHVPDVYCAECAKRLGLCRRCGALLDYDANTMVTGDGCVA